MSGILGFLAALALIVTALAVMVGALEPGEALRRLGVALLLILIVPALLQAIIRSVIEPFLSSAVTDLGRLAVILVVVALIALVGWLVLKHAQAQYRRSCHGD